MFAQGVDAGEGEKVQYSNMEGKQDDKKKKLVIGCVVASLLIVSVIIIAVTTGKDGALVPDDASDDLSCQNPMCNLYLTKPNFQMYTFENSDQAYEDEFWNDEIFGGPITEPLIRPPSEAAAEGVDKIEVVNAMVEDLKENYKNKGEISGELSGYFVLQNIKYGTRNFDDFWIFINNIDQEGYDLLMTINGTTEAHENRAYIKIRKYLNGYVRDIYYNSHDSSNPINPNIAEQNRIIYIFEGYYDNGVLIKGFNEKFGRQFLTNSHCLIGFFTYDTSERAFLLLGQGMIIDGKTDTILEEGLFRLSVNEPQKRQTVDDFETNFLPLD